MESTGSLTPALSNTQAAHSPFPPAALAATKPAAVKEESKPKNKSEFAALGLIDDICRAVHEAGYESPTPIQKDAIPKLLNGRDVFASADTGTGKTAAFMLPALQKLSVKSEKPGKGPRIVVLTPTRELATQITNAARKYSTFLPRMKIVSILGGMPYEPQRKDLRHFVDVLVATPGRLLDHTREGKVDYSRVELFVLDEADRMLDMGFLEDVQLVANELPQDRQTVLFSATLHKRILSLAETITKDPIRIEIAQSEQTNDNVQQKILFANDESHKRKLLQAILENDNVTQAIVFSATKAHTEILADYLEENGIAAAAIHGDLRQRSREAVLRKLRTNKFKVLVATDVASRGIDIPGLSHVINYDIPRSSEDYTHRIGRTGRAGNTGTAITLVSGSERHKLRFIEKDLGHQVQVEIIPGLEPKPMAPGGNGGRSDRSRGGSSRGRFSNSRGGNGVARGGNFGGGNDRRGGFSDSRGGENRGNDQRRDNNAPNNNRDTRPSSGGAGESRSYAGGDTRRSGPPSSGRPSFGGGAGRSSQGNSGGRRDGGNGGGDRRPSRGR